MVTFFEMHLNGEVSISERTGSEAPYGSKDIAENEGGCNFCVRTNEDDEGEDRGFIIGFSRHHMEDDNLERAFHVAANLEMTLAQIRDLAAFLEFLIKARG